MKENLSMEQAKEEADDMLSDINHRLKLNRDMLQLLEIENRDLLALQQSGTEIVEKITTYEKNRLSLGSSKEIQQCQKIG